MVVEHGNELLTHVKIFLAVICNFETASSYFSDHRRIPSLDTIISIAGFTLTEALFKSVSGITNSSGIGKFTHQS